MNPGIVALVFALQIVLALIVLAFLKHRLDVELTASALEHFEVFKPLQDCVLVKSIEVTAGRALSEDIQARLKRIAARRFKEAKLVFSTDPGVQGGVMIKLDGQIMDFTVKKRLEHLFKK